MRNGEELCVKLEWKSMASARCTEPAMILAVFLSIVCLFLYLACCEDDLEESFLLVLFVLAINSPESKNC